MKKIIKITSILLIIIIFCTNIIYADGDEDITNITIQRPNGDNIVTDLVGVVLGVVQVVALCVMVTSIVILSIKYMVSSVNEKATIKQQLVPIIIGSAIIFGASWFMGVAKTFMAEAVNEFI